jgi:predicted DNA-binding ribbon-helix-helix protein
VCRHRDVRIAHGKTIERMVPENPTRSAAPSGQIPRHRIYSGGKRTSISLEREFWDAFLEIAAARRVSPGDLLSVAVAEAPAVNRSSAVRIFVLMHFRRLATDRSGMIG